VRADFLHPFSIEGTILSREPISPWTFCHCTVFLKRQAVNSPSCPIDQIFTHYLSLSSSVFCLSSSSGVLGHHQCIVILGNFLLVQIRLLFFCLFIHFFPPQLGHGNCQDKFLLPYQGCLVTITTLLPKVQLLRSPPPEPNGGQICKEDQFFRHPSNSSPYSFFPALPLCEVCKNILWLVKGCSPLSLSFLGSSLWACDFVIKFDEELPPSFF